MIPSPAPEFSNVTADYRGLIENLVTSENRLVCGFLLTSNLPRLPKGGEGILAQYATVQVARRAEYVDCGPGDFEQVISGAKEQIGSAIKSSTKEAEEELNRRMKTLDLDNLKLSVGQPVILGTLFSKKDAYGFAMVLEVAVGSQHVKMVAGGAMMRVKNRLLFAYLCSEYKNEETVKYVRGAAEQWSDAILVANK